MSLDPLAIAAASNWHLGGIPYAELPATTLEPNGYTADGTPYWRFGVASNQPVFGVVDLPNGAYAGVQANGYTWSAQPGIQQYQEPVDVSLLAFDIDPYATPTPLSAGTEIFHGSDADARIFGTGTGSLSGPTPSASSVVGVGASTNAIPWGLIIVAVIIVVLISNDR